MQRETWHSTAVPLLEVIANGEVEAHGTFRIGDLADSTGLDPMAVAVEIDRLVDGGYISGQLKKVLSGGDPRPWHLAGARLAPAGARVVGLWPSTDPYEALVSLLERRISEADDEPTRSRLRKVRDTVTGLAREVGSNVIANILVELGRSGI